MADPISQAIADFNAAKDATAKLHADEVALASDQATLEAIEALLQADLAALQPPPPPPVTGTRVAVKDPYAADSWVKRRLDQTKAVYGPSAGIGGGAVNAGSWSIAVYYATATDPLVTMTGKWGSAQLHIPANAQPPGPPGGDGAVVIVAPDGVTADGFYQFNPATHTSVTHAHEDIRGSGVGFGWLSTTQVGGLAGLILHDELVAANFPKTLRLGLPTSILSNYFQYPAVSQDGARPEGGAPDHPNTGSVNYGAHLALPPALDLSTLGLTSPQGHALATTAQDRGIVVVERAGQPVLMAESRCEGMPELAALRLDAPKVLSRLVVVTNGANGVPGTGPGDCLAAPDAPAFA